MINYLKLLLKAELIDLKFQIIINCKIWDFIFIVKKYLNLNYFLIYSLKYLQLNRQVHYNQNHLFIH